MSGGYRLGIDIGVNSLGWCAFRLDDKGRPSGILDLGVRIFTDGRDPQKGASLAVDRRVARSMRRRRDRYLLRRDDLMQALIRHGLMPADEAARKALEALDPYALRASGLDETLPLHHLGRALFHLHQRRGFKSNRKTDKGDEKDAGKIKTAISKLHQQMAETGARTLGEYLHKRHERRESVRARLRGEGAKAEYELYPQRAMLEAEFDALWARQAPLHPELTDAARDDIRHVMFRQRPLRPVDPGKCTLDPTDKRAPAALPIAQDFRIIQELANLGVVNSDFTTTKLTAPQRAKLYSELERKPKLPFDRMRRLLGLDSSVRFNLESEKRKDIKGHETNVALARKTRFGERWFDLAEDQRTAIVEALLDESDEAKLFATAKSDWGLDDEVAQAVVDAGLPDGYVRLGRRALAKLVPIMRDQGLVYADAAREAGYHHSDFRSDALLDALPYYGQALERHVSFGTGDPADGTEKRYGRIANPTVHIGLNQLRKLVNAVIDTHGRPAQIVVELARELKQSQERKQEIQKEQAENQRKNDVRRDKLKELGLPDNAENMMRLRLWEELAPEPHARRCVYTGRPIGIEMLFDGSVDIDHILPFRLSLDDSPANKIVCVADANRQKARHTPFGAFGHRPDWPEIQARAEALPKNKRWRFAADALDRLKVKNLDGLPADVLAEMQLGEGFLARNLIDTQYLSRLTREYLGQICDPNQVYVIPGRLTALLRGKWGLNGILSDSNLKNRADHRHHAIDAAVIGLTDRATLQRVAHAAETSRDRLIDDMPDPWPGFRDALREHLARAVVSVRPDHGTGGRLHEETAYGLVADPAKEDGGNLVYRKAFAGLNENEIGRIRDRDLRARVQTHVAAARAAANTEKLSAVALKAALADFAANGEKYRGIRHVRLLKTEADVIAIRDRRNGVPYKAVSPGENHHIDIYENPDGKWVAEAVSVFDANRINGSPTRRVAHPAARRVMQVHKGDLIKLEHNGLERVMRVVRLEISANRLRLAEHTETGNLEDRHNDKDDPFRWLFQTISKMKGAKARKVSVDVIGRVRDPGPPT